MLRLWPCRFQHRPVSHNSAFLGWNRWTGEGKHSGALRVKRPARSNRSLTPNDSEHRPTGGPERSWAAPAYIRHAGAQGIALAPKSVRSGQRYTCPSAHPRVISGHYYGSTRTQYRVQEVSIQRTGQIPCRRYPPGGRPPVPPVGISDGKAKISDMPVLGPGRTSVLPPITPAFALPSPTPSSQAGCRPGGGSSSTYPDPVRAPPRWPPVPDTACCASSTRKYQFRRE